MANIKYNKLVRNKIPEIIRAEGKQCEAITLSDRQYIELLDMKLFEEVLEYQNEKTAEEMADILEVLEAISDARGYSWEDILRIQKEKREARGGFDQKILLVSAESDIPETTGGISSTMTDVIEDWDMF